MNPVFKKLHLIDKDPVLVLNAPEEYYETLEELEVEIHDEVQDDYEYVQVFAQDIEEGHAVIREVITALLPGAYFWFSYPKETSENYETELYEKNVNKIFEMFNLEAVTLVSLNEDWQAIRIKFSDEEDKKSTSVEKGPRKFHNLTD